MAEVWIIILAIVICLLTIYYYGFLRLNYFKKRKIPYVPPVPLLGNMAQTAFGKRTFIDTVLHAYNYNRDAKYVGFFDFMDPVIVIRDPELIKSITIKNFDHFPDHKMLSEDIPDTLFRKGLFGLQGQQWRDQRTLLSPTFTTRKMKIIFKLMKECTLNFIDYLKLQSVETTSFDMKDLLTKYTNDIIVTAAFGISVDSFKDPQNEFLVTGKEATNFSGARTLKLFLLRMFPWISKLLNIRIWNSKITKFYNKIIRTTIAMRDAKKITRPDMLQLMMETRNKNEMPQMTIDHMVANTFMFYFGGFDTTALVTCFALHEVVVNPDVYSKLQAKVDQVMEKCSGKVTYAALHSMQYLDAVINETLRLHSPAIIIDRLCRKKFELPPALPNGEALIVEPGISIWIPVSAIHIDPIYHPNPEKFDPDRFTNENKDSIDSTTFLPFGNGPRFCVGNRFALMEAKLVLFELIANFDIKPCSKTVNPLKLTKLSFVPTIDGGVWLEIKPRTY